MGEVQPELARVLKFTDEAAVLDEMTEHSLQDAVGLARQADARQNVTCAFALQVQFQFRRAIRQNYDQRNLRVEAVELAYTHARNAGVRSLVNRAVKSLPCKKLARLLYSRCASDFKATWPRCQAGE
jgi:hypothetical protein